MIEPIPQTCSATGHAEGFIAARINNSLVNLLLAQLSQTRKSDVHVVLVWEGDYLRAKISGLPSKPHATEPAALSAGTESSRESWHYLRSHRW